MEWLYPEPSFVPNIYTNDLCSATTNASTKSYVDETKLYLSFPLEELNEGLVRLKADLNKLGDVVV